MKLSAISIVVVTLAVIALTAQAPTPAPQTPDRHACARRCAAGKTRHDRCILDDSKDASSQQTRERLFVARTCASLEAE